MAEESRADPGSGSGMTNVEAGSSTFSTDTPDPSTIASAGNGPLPRSGEELVGGGGQLKRAGHDRWGPRKEKLFFDELAATANVKRSAKAAGVSPNAVYARRLRDRHFRAKWAAVLENGRASIEMHLVEAANRSFDPDELDTGAVEPKVSVTEAIRIVQAHGSRAERALLPDPYGDDAPEPNEEEIAAARERLDRKLRRVRDREMPALFAQGWSFDEEHDHLVPPGWVRVEPAREAEAVTE